jgi:hypothetical protein
MIAVGMVIEVMASVLLLFVLHPNINPMKCQSLRYHLLFCTLALLN